MDPMSTLTLPERRKTKIYKTSHSSGSKLSKPAAIAIVVVVAVVLIAAIVVSIIMQRRRKARARADKHSSTLPGFSTDNGDGGLYGRMPSYYAGSRDGGGQQQQQQQQLHGDAAREKHSAGDYGEYPGGDGGGGQGAAADYYAESQLEYAQAGGGGGLGVQGRDYGRGSYEMPHVQRPPMAFNPSPAQV